MELINAVILTALLTGNPQTVHRQVFHSMEACEKTRKAIFPEVNSVCVADKEVIVTVNIQQNGYVGR